MHLLYVYSDGWNGAEVILFSVRMKSSLVVRASEFWYVEGYCLSASNAYCRRNFSLFFLPFNGLVLSKSIAGGR